MTERKRSSKKRALKDADLDGVSGGLGIPLSIIDQLPPAAPAPEPSTSGGASGGYVRGDERVARFNVEMYVEK